MKYSFNTYQFDCDKKILTQDGQVVSLNEKAAKLLALFLLNNDKVISKQEILETVWADRVVTEQVVFQNISQLRALFGNNAIKTFSKMGYQWQLALNELDDSPPLQQLAESSAITEFKQQTIKQGVKEKTHAAHHHKKQRFDVKKIALSGLVALLCIIAIAITTRFLSPMNVSEGQHVFQIKTSDKSYKKVFGFGAQQVFDSPFTHWQSVENEESPLLVATQLYPVEKAVALRFIVQGAQRNWQDHLIAENAHDAEMALADLLHALSDSDYLSISSDFGALAELNVLAHALPNNELVKRQLVKSYTESEQLQQANVLLNDLLANYASQLEYGMLLLLKNDLAMKQKNWPQAKQSALQAIDVLMPLSLSHLLASAHIQASWSYMFEENFREGMAILNSAATHARKAEQALLEVEATAIQAYFANKAGEIELAYTQLDLANQLITFHQLGDEHSAMVLYYSGWIEQDETKKVVLYEALINTPYSTIYQTYFYSAASALRNIYVRQRTFDKAASTLKPWQAPSYQLYSRALLAFAKQETLQGLALIEQAFLQAQLDHQRYVALDAALLLVQHDSEQKQTAIAYIIQKATPRWLDQNPTGRALIR